LQFLEHFAEQPFSPVLGSDISTVFETPPFLSHVFRDVDVALFPDNVDLPGQLVRCATGEVADDLDISDLHASMLFLDTGSFDPSNLCASIGVESHNSEGLYACGARLPSAAEHLGIPSTGDLPNLETAYTPRGHISKIHIDGVW
ncbi:hypothetical protein V8E36_003148, partial [Tilletia maclaganii]